MSAQRPVLSGFHAPRRKRERRSLVERVAGWHLVKAPALSVLFGLALHEVLYHALGGDDFPLAVIFNGARAFVVSHGGLDSLAVGAMPVLVVFLILACRGERGKR